MKYNKINDSKYEIVNNGQVIGIVEKPDNTTVWTATATTGESVFRPTRKRASEGLVWKLEKEELL